MDSHIGESAALLTSACWTVTALAFEFAARRIGSLALNILRLVAALLMFGLLGLLVRGALIPLDAAPAVWFWLSLSGLVGFVFGDVFLFQAYIDIGARTTQVVFAASPLLTAMLGFFVLGERISPSALVGMVVVVAAIALVILARTPDPADSAAPVPARIVPAARRGRGALFALLGALGQSGGLILSKIGAPAYDPFAATQIRVIAGLAGFLVLAVLMRRSREPLRALRDAAALRMIGLGAFFGPFLGVSLGLFAVQRAASGSAAALMGLTPILILLPAVLIKKERLSLREILGAIAAVAGSALVMLG